MAQKKGNEAGIVGAAVLGSIIASAIAIEEIKEQLESEAVTHILSNYPELKEFSLEVIFDKGETYSSESGTGVLTFKINILNKSLKTRERKILLRFNNNGFINEYGLNINKIEYLMFDINEWNSMMAFYGNLTGIGDSIHLVGVEDNLSQYSVPLYKFIECNNTDWIIKGEYYSHMGIENEECFIKSENNSLISSLEFYNNGFHPLSNYINSFQPSTKFDIEFFPLYKLRGDDYIVGDYSSEFRIFSNENTIGLFLKWMDKTILFKHSAIREIHSFLNFNYRINNETEEVQEIIEDDLKPTIVQPGLYYNGNLCEIITEISETEVKIKYITETGRGFYKKIVNLSDIEEVK